ncbi:MAG: metalloregulator ArsR/SmtB family transcription factor [candidate division WOR-3 bacterium]
MQRSTTTTPARLLAALGNPVRLKLVALLGEGERCVCDLTSEFRQDPSVICRHLQVLDHAGIVRSRRSGVRNYYQLSDHRFLELVVKTLDILDKPDAGRPVGPVARVRDSCCPADPRKTR